VSELETIRATCTGCGYWWFPQLKNQSNPKEKTREQIEKELNAGYDCPNEGCKFYGTSLEIKNHWKCNKEK
jgi:hypothetical protein